MAESATETADATTDRDPARAALRDLVTLSSETAARETEIQQSHAAALEAAEKEFIKAKSNLDMRVKTVREELEQKYQARLEQINARHAAEMAELKETDAARRRQINAEYEKLN